MTAEHPNSDVDGHDHLASPRSESVLEIRVDYDQCVNYAMQQNDVPVVKLLSIGNVGTEPLEELGLHVWIDHDISQRMQSPARPRPS